MDDIHRQCSQDHQLILGIHRRGRSYHRSWRLHSCILGYRCSQSYYSGSEGKRRSPATSDFRYYTVKRRYYLQKHRQWWDSISFQGFRHLTKVGHSVVCMISYSKILLSLMSLGVHFSVGVVHFAVLLMILGILLLSCTIHLQSFLVLSMGSDLGSLKYHNLDPYRRWGSPMSSAFFLYPLPIWQEPQVIWVNLMASHSVEASRIQKPSQLPS